LLHSVRENRRHHHFISRDFVKKHQRILSNTILIRIRVDWVRIIYLDIVGHFMSKITFINLIYFLKKSKNINCPCLNHPAYILYNQYRSISQPTANIQHAHTYYYLLTLTHYNTVLHITLRGWYMVHEAWSSRVEREEENPSSIIKYTYTI
jgi:hypothetical protein